MFGDTGNTMIGGTMLKPGTGSGVMLGIRSLRSSESGFCAVDGGRAGALEKLAPPAGGMIGAPSDKFIHGYSMLLNALTASVAKVLTC
jgi:hypothetical protein